MTEIENRRIGRTLTLLGTHSIVLYDCYILGLPMFMVMWWHWRWEHGLIYLSSLALILPSLFRWRHPLFRDVLYLAGMACLYYHWYQITSADNIAYKTEPFTRKGIEGSLPFQITTAVQPVLILLGYVKARSPSSSI